MPTIREPRVMQDEGSRSRDRASPRSRELRVALVHDWLVTLGGSDRVLLALHQLYPQAPVFVSLYDRSKLPAPFSDLEMQTSWLQRFPSAVRHHRSLVPLMPAAFASFRLRGYDVVISSSHACAKGVRIPAGAVHICYCHTPMRYAWDLQAEYVRGFTPLLRPAIRLALARLRRWDLATVRQVDHFVANSRFVASRIQRHYGREATVIYPPVDLEYFTPAGASGGYFLVVSRLVPYKRVDLAVAAFARLGRPLVVVGDGPEGPGLRKAAGPNVQFVGEVDDETLRDYYRGCTALVFPGEEDFGLVPVEAQACGRPVLAFGRGGATESVIEGLSGAFFREQTVDSLVEALQKFDARAYHPAVIRRHAERFSVQRFHREMTEFVDRVVSARPVTGSERTGPMREG